MRQFASSVCVITTAHGGKLHGVTVTSLASVSVEPPMLLVCIHRDSSCAAAIARTGLFCVNLLSEGAKATACLFAGTSGEARHLRFDRVAWTEGHGNCPILDESLTTFECAVSDSLQVATHRVFFAMVVGAKSGRGEAPLIYSDRAFRRLAALERQI